MHPHHNCILVFGGSYFENASKRIESGKKRRFMIEETWRNTAFLECIAVSAYVHEVLQKIF